MRNAAGNSVGNFAENLVGNSAENVVGNSRWKSCGKFPSLQEKNSLLMFYCL